MTGAQFEISSRRYTAHLPRPKRTDGVTTTVAGTVSFRIRPGVCLTAGTRAALPNSPIARSSHNVPAGEAAGNS